MTSQQVDVKPLLCVIKQENEEVSEKAINEMKPPLNTRVPKSRKGLKRRRKPADPITCKICQKTYQGSHSLRYHIRQAYFNLRGKTLLHEIKNINQVWVEKVLNSNELIQITKIGRNVLRMKKTKSNMKIEPNVIEEIDLTCVYSTNYKFQFKLCPVCDVKIPRKKYNNHLEMHMF